MKGEKEKPKRDEVSGIGVVCCPPDIERVREIIPHIKALREALKERGNVVMTRLDNEDLEKIDSLVEIDLFKSRSEAVAYFIHAGIEARKGLFEKVMPTVEKIHELKEQAKKALGKS